MERGSYKEIFVGGGGGGLFLIELLEIFQKEALRTPGGFDKKRWRKNRIRGVMVRKETM